MYSVRRSIHCIEAIRGETTKIFTTGLFSQLRYLTQSTNRTIFQSVRVYIYIYIYVCVCVCVCVHVCVCVRAHFFGSTSVTRARLALWPVAQIPPTSSHTGESHDDHAVFVIQHGYTRKTTLSTGPRFTRFASLTDMILCIDWVQLFNPHELKIRTS